MKYILVTVFAAFVLCQAASAFKAHRFVYVVPAAATTTTTEATTNSTATTTTTAAPVVVQQIVFCSWKNNWCRPTSSNSVGNCKWGFCKFTG
ncbi:hypothetical protein KR018_012387 [Drosophila ironensis]|nr:hypothetical protein KR018_012387 [Drosophila ironensis]